MKSSTRKVLNFLFIAATMAMVIILAFGNSELENAWQVLFTLNPYWLGGAVLCWFCYLFFDACGYHLFLKNQNHRVKMRFALFISMIGFYYGNITPGASGGQPMQVYYMKKRDIPIGIGTSAISLKFMSNQLMTVTIASVLWICNATFIAAQLDGVMWAVIIGWIINFSAVPLILLITLHRPFVQSIVAFFVRMGAKFKLIKKPDDAMLRMNAILDTYHSSVLRLGRHPKQILVQLVLSALSMLGLTCVVICVYHAFGEVGTPWYQLLTLAFLLFLSASYTPLPGASGAQEGGFLAFYRGLFTSGTIGLALLVWRFATYYLFIIIGAVMTIAMQLRSGKKTEAAASSETKTD
ncbi:MAG: flippase-like domain-containing protein [Clostridiales bacterium]|nr:flippase-like domain-containing protein [Clostridiales bacterium]